MKTFYDMFAGIGGFRLPLETEGWKCVGGCEIDKHARSVYKRNFSELPSDMDIRQIDARNLPDCTMYCGGFPCPTFSLAGKRLGFKDPRGELFFEICRLVGQRKPELLLLENVKGLLSHDRGRTFAVILDALDGLGYGVEWQVLNSKDFGVPQNRERVFIVGHLGGLPTRKVFPLGERTQIPDKAERGKSEKRKGLSGAHITSTIDAGYGALKNCGETYLKYIHNSTRRSDRVYDVSGVAPTLVGTAGGVGAKTGLIMLGHTKANIKKRRQDRDSTWTLDTGGSKQGIIEGDKVRRLTPTECERLQGFPDGWTKEDDQGNPISDTQRYKMLGNAVTVPVVRAIARRINEVCS